MMKNAMTERPFPHKLIPPPEPFPTWQGGGGGPLVYLAWGHRDYHRFPIPIHSNPGWTYWILLQGEAVVEMPGSRMRFQAGSGFMGGPDCAFGFPRQPFSNAAVLVWIWRDPPRCPGNPDPAGLSSVRFRPEQIRMLEDLHRQTRMEIFQPQRHGDSALAYLSGLVEIQFARAEGREASDPDDILLGRAKQWMFEHFSQIASMADLAQYLGISVMRLHRLFHAGTGMSPGSFYHDLKMKHCAGLLSRPAYSVKRVAYETGYRHANDFSRAFKTHFGYPPSEQARRGAV
ncbi:MAG: AraC family transcriptional regulator [Puniceicoccaceae bacterium]|nr:MAG: AraC family transcriptional regulator [Puniceicoccaceae bacterium]